MRVEHMKWRLSYNASLLCGHAHVLLIWCDFGGRRKGREGLETKTYILRINHQRAVNVRLHDGERGRQR